MHNHGGGARRAPQPGVERKKRPAPGGRHIHHVNAKLKVYHYRHLVRPHLGASSSRLSEDKKPFLPLLPMHPRPEPGKCHFWALFTLSFTHQTPPKKHDLTGLPNHPDKLSPNSARRAAPCIIPGEAPGGRRNPG